MGTLVVDPSQVSAIAVDPSQVTAITPGADRPSIVSDAVKYSPLGMVQGLAGMIRTAVSGKNPLAGMPEANEQLLEKAKDSFQQGHYADAAAHFANYLNPFGGAFEDVSNDLEQGNYGHAAAKFAGLATGIVAGEKAPALLNAATQPDLISNGTRAVGNAAGAAGTVARGAVKGIAAGKINYVKDVLIPGLVSDSLGMGRGPGEAAGLAIKGVRGAVAGIKTAMAERSAALAAADTAAAVAAQRANPAVPVWRAFPAQEAAPDASIPEPETDPAAATLASGRTVPTAAERIARAEAAPIDTAPDARATLSPEMTAKADALQAQTHPGAPPQTIEQMLQAEFPAFRTGPEFDQQTLDAAAEQLGGYKNWKTVPDNGKALILNLLRSGKPAAQEAAAAVSSPAEQIHENLLNGLIDQGWTPPDPPAGDGPLVTPEGQAAIREMMVSLPKDARLPMARAAYAGDQTPELADATYSAAHGANKAEAMAAELRRQGVRSSFLESNFTPEDLAASPVIETVRKSLGLKTGMSPLSIAQTIRALKVIEDNEASPK
jgi:hypothetical protein